MVAFCTPGKRICPNLLALVFSLLVLAMSRHTNAQGCVMACPAMDPPVWVSIGPDCVETLTADDLGVVAMGCAGPFIVQIFDNGIPIGNTITGDMIGNTYMVTVISQAEGQSCMTAIAVEDKLPPVITCPETIVVSCFTDLSTIPFLTDEDALDCSDVTVTWYDELIYSGNCDSDFISKYRRTYYAVDVYLNATSCTQMIFMERVSLSDVVFPPDIKGDDALHCYPPPDTSPVFTGSPEVGGFPIVNGLVCNLFVTYSDETASLCSGGYKIFRTWVVIDWCDGGILLDSIQIIEVADLTPPTIQSPDTLVVPAGIDCNADVLMPAALVGEDCSANVVVRMQGSFGTIHSNGGLVQGLPVGAHTVIYIATNDCLLESRDTTIVIVADLTPPNAICNNAVVVPVGPSGYTTVHAGAFDSGSFDNCGPVYFKVKRMSLPAGFQCNEENNPGHAFDDVIRFCCEDVTDDQLMITLRVYDIPPGPGVVGDGYLSGHFSDCMLLVDVQDKIAPTIECPSNLTVSCEFLFDPSNLSVFGEVVTDPAERDQICIDDIGNPYTIGLTCVGLDGLASDNCFVTISETSDIDIEDACGSGLIRRFFTATDPEGLTASCQQQITIINYTPFTENDIQWPPDYTTYDVCEPGLLDPEDLPPPYQSPVVYDGACDLVTFTHQDIVFDFTVGQQACFKILRTWTVLDWCQYQTGGSVGIWTRTQVIKVINTVAPQIALTQQEFTLCTDDPACGPGNVILQASATDDCSNPDILRWTVGVDLHNNGSLDQVFLSVTGADFLRQVQLPLGAHRVLYSVEDRCGNATTREQYITVVSCKPPTAICRNLTTTLMPVDTDGDHVADWGMVTLWANDLDAGSHHACGNPVSVAFSVNPAHTSYVFDCSHLGQNQVALWVIDDIGNMDFCLVTVTIQDNFDVCPEDFNPHGTISGKVATALVEQVPGVEVRLHGSTLPAQTTDDQGAYAFPLMPLGGSYQIEPVLDTEHKKGVSTLDLVILQKHLLGVQLLQDPYKIIAADANRSQTLSAMDIVQLRRLILGITQELPNNTSWRFVDAAYDFGDPQNPLIELFPESYAIPAFDGDMTDVSFIAVKVGDLNGSAMSGFQNGEVAQRNAAVRWTLSARDRVLTPGEVHVVDLFADQMHRVEATQFALSWNKEPLTVRPVFDRSILSDAQCNVLRTEDGVLPVSWTVYDSEPKTDQPFISLEIEVAATMLLSEIELIVDRKEMDAECALIDGQMARIEISILPVQSVESGMVMYQNRPNPFARRTVIPYVLDANETVQLEVFDLQGARVFHREVSSVAGYNEFLLDRSVLRAPGVYIYTISTTTENRTMRMIVFDE